ATPRPALVTRINVVPLIDVSLVLVIILLVTAPLLSVASLPVDLPKAQTREAEDDRNISITLGSDGRLAVDQRLVTLPELRGVLASRLQGNGDRNVLVVVRADS